MTKTDIANFALSELGTKRIVDIAADTGKLDRTMSLHYDQARREVLRAGHWNFAMARRKLVAASDAPAYKYAYQYPVPADFIRLAEVNDVSVLSTSTEEWFALEQGRDSENNSIGTCLLTDLGDVWIRYVSDYEDTTQFDPLFVSALTILLAAKACRAVTGSEKRSEKLVIQYEEMTLPSAQHVDSTEDNSNENNLMQQAIRRSHWVRSRGSFGQDGPLPSAPSETEESGGGIGAFTVS